jgi:hypothetical protein
MRIARSVITRYADFCNKSRYTCLEGKPYRYACLEPHPDKKHLLVSILEDHTIDNPSDVVTTLVIINTVTKSLHPLVSGADFYAMPKFSPGGNRITWQQWYYPDMPWDGGEVHIADVIVNDNTLSLTGEIHVAGVRGKVSAGYPSWRDNDNLIFTSDESGYINPWKFTNGMALPLFPEPIAEDFGAPLWVLSFSFYALIHKEGKFALFSAVKNGRDVLYLVDLNGGLPPKLIDSPFVAIDMIKTISLEREEVVFKGQQTDDKPTIIHCSLSSLQSLCSAHIFANEKESPFSDLDASCTASFSVFLISLSMSFSVSGRNQFIPTWV